MLPGRQTSRIVRSGPGPKVDEALFGDTRAQAARKNKLTIAPQLPSASISPSSGVTGSRKVVEPVVMAASDLHSIAVGITGLMPWLPLICLSPQGFYDLLFAV